MKALYVTTPIYYVNGDPHIGHAHTTVMADILKRAALMRGIPTFLSTGTDEHGQKNQESAEQSGLSTADYLARQSGRFRAVFERLDVGFDHWVRTSAESHQKVVRHILADLHAKGHIVKKPYTGLYCVGCEMFKKASDLDAEGLCKDHRTKPTETTETNYFFEIEPFRGWLVDTIEGDPDWIRPAAYRTEVLNMLREPLDDLSISRPRERVKLGVPLPFDEDFVAYVWFDALINYVSTLGWPEDRERFERWWPGVVHLMAKDIVKTHCIYWPIMLKAAGIDPPHAFRIHGYWVGEGGVKMSKSLGNVVEPLAMIETFGVDSLRFYLARAMRGGDASISPALVATVHNSQLVNSVGNLYSRAIKLYKKHYGASVQAAPELAPPDAAVRDWVVERASAALADLDLEGIADLAAAIVEISDRLNQHFGDAAPWALAKDPAQRPRLDSVLYATLDSLRLLFELAHPILPETSRRALANLGLEPIPDAPRAHAFAPGRLPAGAALGADDHLFPRVEAPA